MAINPVSLGARALMFGLDNIENARGNLPGFPPGTEPHHNQQNIALELGGILTPGGRSGRSGRGGGKAPAGGGRGPANGSQG